MRSSMDQSYLDYWGFQRAPFALTPDPDMLYLSKQHRECLLRLQYTIAGNKGGALLVSEAVTRRIAAPAVPIRSRVGAGDSMVAGLVLALAQGRSLEEAATYGVAAGSAAVMTPGSELCRREDTERIFRRMSTDR